MSLWEAGRRGNDTRARWIEETRMEVCHVTASGEQDRGDGRRHGPEGWRRQAECKVYRKELAIPGGVRVEVRPVIF